MVRWRTLLARGGFATGVGGPGFRAIKGAFYPGWGRMDFGCCGNRERRALFGMGAAGGLLWGSARLR